MNQPLNRGWEFRRLDESSLEWVPVDLPHCPFVADLDGRQHWFGECEYRRPIQSPPLTEGSRCLLYLGAAMHTCEAFVGSHRIAKHLGGYLPFEIDLTEHLDAHGCCVVVLRLNNRDNPDVPPGKPYADLDFCWYGGLYRPAELRIRPALHLTDAISSHEPGGGGVFLRTLAADEKHAEVLVRAQVRNNSPRPRTGKIHAEFRFLGRTIASVLSDPILLAPGQARHLESRVTLSSPALWSPAAPQLYDVAVSLVDESSVPVDSLATRFGVRRIAFSRSGGFTINGRRLRLRGTNRHQEFPRVGYAAPAAAQFRDARRIKEAGFDYVRMSHYPQSSDFLAACDELGLVVMACIPGWQFMGGPAFAEAVCENARQLVRRDRNHACVVLWELSLNETEMDEALMARLHAIGHEEYPGDQMFTCGWMDRFDVFSHSRQHGEIHRWCNGDKALVIAEYGDWEYYARDEGFDQKTGAGVYDAWSTARQFRGDGERALSQQAFNHLTALNDTLASPAALDGQWSMFDYARGYHPIRAACGVMDIFRLPKFSYHFYRSQRDATEAGPGWAVGPVVFIASHWTPASALRFPVFSNCDEVGLYHNGRLISRQRPTHSHFTRNLPHPPFYFDLPRFTPGSLEAVGYIGGLPATTHVVRTPENFSRLEIVVDDLGLHPQPDDADVLFVHARLCDANGTLCIEEHSAITFAVEGAVLLGPAVVQAEAGVASIVVRLPAGTRDLAVTATVKTMSETICATHDSRKPSQGSPVPPPRLVPA